MNHALDGIFGTARTPKRILGSALTASERLLELADAASAGIITAVAGDSSLGLTFVLGFERQLRGSQAGIAPFP